MLWLAEAYGLSRLDDAGPMPNSDVTWKAHCLMESTGKTSSETCGQPGEGESGWYTYPCRPKCVVMVEPDVDAAIWETGLWCQKPPSADSWGGAAASVVTTNLEASYLAHGRTDCRRMGNY